MFDLIKMLNNTKVVGITKEEEFTRESRRGLSLMT